MSKTPLFARRDKQTYRVLCDRGLSVPIFSTPWWLDVTCGRENWDVILVSRGATVAATMPFAFKHGSFGMDIHMPPLTQKLGPTFAAMPVAYVDRLTLHKEICDEIISALPDYATFQQQFDYEFDNWLPFYWRGFRQTTYYTYVLDNLHSLECAWRGLQGNIRREIQKASQRHRLVIRHDLPLDPFFDLATKTFEHQGLRPPSWRDLVRTLDQACAERNSRRLFYAQDDAGNLHAAAYIVWDKRSAYYLMGGSDPVLRRSGAMSLLLWEAIVFASEVTTRFDFEGSMLQPIERLFRSFGATQRAYSSISHVPSRRLRVKSALQELKSGLLGFGS